MIDPQLTRRAEQAYLGALIASQGHPDAGEPAQPALLTARDFSDPVHQAIFAALTAQQGSTRRPGPAGWPGRLSDWLYRLLSRNARDAAAYLADLPGQCPEPGNLAAYAAMVTEASEQRASRERARQAQAAAREDSVLASAGDWLDEQGTVSRQPARGPAAPPSPEAARLARALGGQARRLARTGPGEPGAPGRDAGHAAAAPGAPDGSPGRATPEDLEERVLASLMRHPGEGEHVTAWLPAEAFRTATLREVYDLIRQRLDDGRPVDPLIIAWDAARLSDFMIGSGDDTVSVASAALRAGALEPAPGTAEVLGRALWAQHILTAKLGQDWAGDPEAVSKLTVASRAPRKQREPGPAATTRANPARPAGVTARGAACESRPAARPPAPGPGPVQVQHPAAPAAGGAVPQP